MDVDRGNVFIWQNNTSGCFYKDLSFTIFLHAFFCPFSLLQAESCLQAPIFFFFSSRSHFQWPTSPSAPMSQQVQEIAKQGLTVKRIRPGDRTVPRADSMELLISLVLIRIQLRSQGIFQFIKFVDCSYILYWLLLVTTLGSVASLVVYRMFPEGPGHQ